jgi:hypothetical protein
MSNWEELGQEWSEGRGWRWEGERKGEEGRGWREMGGRGTVRRAGRAREGLGMREECNRKLLPLLAAAK